MTGCRGNRAWGAALLIGGALAVALPVRTVYAAAGRRRSGRVARQAGPVGQSDHGRALILFVLGGMRTRSWSVLARRNWVACGMPNR